MARIARMVVEDEKAVYHVISRTTLGGLPIGDEEKTFFVDYLEDLGRRYFLDVLGFCVMSTHFHLLLEVTPPNEIPKKAVRERFGAYYGDKREWSDQEASGYLARWTSLPEYVKELRQRFSWFYNQKHGRRGAFWSERYKSLLLEKGLPLLYCLAYIDLNPVRAGLVDRPEAYRWNSLGFRKRTSEKNDFLSLDIGWPALNVSSRKKALKRYMDFLEDAGRLRFSNDEIEEMLTKSVAREEIPGDVDLKALCRLRKQHRWFQDSGILGSREFVTKYYLRFKHHFSTKKEKKPKKISGLDGIYSMKRLSEKARWPLRRRVEE